MIKDTYPPLSWQNGQNWVQSGDKVSSPGGSIFQTGWRAIDFCLWAVFPFFFNYQTMGEGIPTWQREFRRWPPVRTTNNQYQPGKHWESTQTSDWKPSYLSLWVRRSNWHFIWIHTQHTSWRTPHVQGMCKMGPENAFGWYEAVSGHHQWSHANSLQHQPRWFSF